MAGDLPVPGRSFCRCHSPERQDDARLVDRTSATDARRSAQHYYEQRTNDSPGADQAVADAGSRVVAVDSSGDVLPKAGPLPADPPWISSVRAEKLLLLSIEFGFGEHPAVADRGELRELVSNVGLRRGRRRRDRSNTCRCHDKRRGPGTLRLRRRAESLWVLHDSAAGCLRPVRCRALPQASRRAGRRRWATSWRCCCRLERDLRGRWRLVSFTRHLAVLVEAGIGLRRTSLLLGVAEHRYELARGQSPPPGSSSLGICSFADLRAERRRARSWSHVHDICAGTGIIGPAGAAPSAATPPPSLLLEQV